MNKGLFITFEGGEGAGKSTQIKLLADKLEAQGRHVVLTHEPGGTPGAYLIRENLVKGEGAQWDKETETLLFFAARRDHIVKKIRPALEQGAVVLCDRFADSTMAYQGYGRGRNDALIDMIRHLYRLVAGDLQPHTTFILDIDPALGLRRSCARKGNNETRFENMDIAFHQNLRAGFLEIARNDPGRCVVIDANRSVAEIHQDIWDKMQERRIC
ncbi:MAG: dTMP kinase [Alphaproteobacteria bacterium]|nr:dTMP kinase [Alphaproteobacteria bacterium]